MRSPSSSIGTAPSLGWLSIGSSCCAIVCTWNSCSIRPRRSTCDWLRYDGSLTRLPIRVCSVLSLAAGIRRVKGVRRLGVRLGNWLSANQAKRLLGNPAPNTLREKRDRAMLAVLVGCGLRRGELLALAMEDVQLREEHWMIADLHGKANHVRTVPMPAWVKRAIDEWTSASGITTGRIFLAIHRTGCVWGKGVTPKVIWQVVKDAAVRAGIETLAPHDLRRTCARLCHVAGEGWSRFSFSWATFRSRPPNATLGQSRSYGTL